MSGKSFYCYECKYQCHRKTHWLQHLKTKKHKLNAFIDSSDDVRNECVCGKVYKHRSSLSKHTKICSEYISFIHDNDTINNIQNPDNGIESNNDNNLYEKRIPMDVNTETTKSECLPQSNPVNDSYLQNNQKNVDQLTDLVNILIKENKDLQSKMFEIAREPRVQNIQNIHMHNNYNIINYLNTNCRDAMNIQDFIEGFEVSLKDLLELRDYGVVYSFKNTFLKQLQNMEQEKRPIHCSDKKRKRFYVKDSNEWKYDKDCETIHSTMKIITNKQCHALQKWKIDNPDWLDNDVKQDDVATITRNICSAYDEPDRGKIVKDITILTIDRSDMSDSC